jgi:hypothetical protein
MNDQCVNETGFLPFSRLRLFNFDKVPLIWILFLEFSTKWLLLPFFVFIKHRRQTGW